MRFKMKRIVIGLLILRIAISLYSESEENILFIGYETIGKALNNSKYFTLEVGSRFAEKNQIRLIITETKLGERQLFSKQEIKSTDGAKVEGYSWGYELNYDRFLTRSFYLSASIGYYEDIYRHTSNERYDNRSFTIGSGVGFRKNNFLEIDHLYYNFSIPVRFYLNEIDVIEFGDTIIKQHQIVNNIWLFFGYEF